MLQELRVEQLAIVDRLAVTFGPGLNVLTGETGAGKSLLVDALALALGGRASADQVRAGAKEGVVEALFAPEKPGARAALDAALADKGLPSGEGVLLVKRVVSAAGRHRVYVNGGLATVGLLAEVAGELVDICGQHEQMVLLRPGAHRELLDAFASAPEVLGGYQRAWEALAEAEAELARLDTDEAARADREAFLRFQLQEIAQLAPEAGELAALEAERGRLRHAERLREAAGLADEALYTGEGAVVDVLGRTCHRLREAAELDPSLAPLVEGLEGALAVVEDHGREVARYAEHLEADPGRLEVVESRVAGLTRLCRRHGGDLDAVLAAAEALGAELDDLGAHDDRLAGAQDAVRRARAAAETAAAALTRVRKTAAGALGKAVAAELAGLGMKATRLEVTVSPAESLGPAGADQVALRIAAGPGEPLRPLAKIASGGELSRILLALRRVLAAGDPVPTVVFDEVDAGIGGATAEVVGRLLKGVAADRQVLCITHLPQVAAYADRHLAVAKDVDGGRARVRVEALDAAGRTGEVARMLGGVTVTERTRETAAELIDRAGHHRPRPPGKRRRRAA